MADGPDLPLLTLRCGAWEVEIADPRPDAFALGARYVHGGYIHRVRRDGRQLTGRAHRGWNPFDGEGMPEVFEHDLAFEHADEGDTYLRIGAGRVLRTGPRRPPRMPLDVAVTWSVLEQGPAHLVMSCHDEIWRRGARFAYGLTRTVRVRADGIDSTTTLTLVAPPAQPVIWFPHAFWAHTRTDGTAYRLPDAARVVGLPTRDPDGWWRVREGEHWGGSGVAHGLWGHRGHIDCRLDDTLGGGSVRLAVDYPWDHVVLWASRHATSAEPFLARAWQRGETATWSVAYTWLDDVGGA